MATRNNKAKKGKVPSFAMMPKVMIQSPGYRSLSFVARMVLVELLAQYNGKNNGDLSATKTMAREWGIGSDNTLRVALRDLDQSGWILMTRSSIFSKHGSRCALYAIAWQPIDECPGKSLEIQPTSTPPTRLGLLINSNPSGAETASV